MKSPRDILKSIWALLAAIAVVAILIAVATFSESKNDVKAVASQIFETKIVVVGEGYAKWHYFDYNLPKAGSATLRLSNDARKNAPSEDRVEGAQVTLRGKKLVTPREFNQKVDNLDVPVRLQAGTNRLGVRLQADAGKRVSLRIDAPADNVVLKPVLNPVVIGRDHLQVQATVTGLGVPVRRAKMLFEVSGLGPVPKVHGSTDRTGTATVFLSGFGKAGTGQLKASLEGTDPLLSNEIPIQVIKAPAIALDHGVKRLSVKEGDDAAVAITVKVLEGGQEGQHVTLDRVINDPKGIAFDLPAGGIIGTEPQLSFMGKVTGIAAGNYTLTTTATITETNDRWSDTLTIVVVDPDAADPLVLSGPSATPPAISPGKAATVKFGAYVSGTHTPPNVLFLHEVDSAGRLKSPHVAELRDDGEKGDDHSGDLTYAGILNFDSKDEKIKTETTINYQLRAEHFGKTVLSPVYTFHVTPLTVGIRPSDSSTLAKDPGSKFMLFSNEVVMGIHPGVKVDSKRAEEIASAAGGTVVGFWPPLRLYMVEIPVDPDADDLQKANNVRKAIEVISTFSEVEYAVPNHETLPLAFPFEAPDDPDFLCPAGTPATACQWYMETIGTLMAWRIAGGGSTIKIALIEGDGTVDFSHDDLTGTAAGSDDHATRVAGLITAIADNTTGIAGVAYDSQVLSYNAYGASQQAVAVENASASSVGARIINISQESSEYSPLENALDTAINTHDALVVIAAGQPANQGCPPAAFTDIWPAKYNQSSYLNEGILAVGATNISDDLAQWNIGSNTWCSNNASWIDLYAPGKDIRSTIPGDSYAAGSGTSFATALTSGAAAVLWGFDHFVTPSGKTRAEAVHDRLIETAETKPALGLCDNGLDCGRLNLHAAVDTTEPYDIVFVLDRSGSMGGSTHISPPATSRWNALGIGVQAFTGIIGSTAPAGSRFGLTLFATNTLAEPLPSPLVDINRDLPDELPGIVNDSGALSQIPSGLTAMGKGLQNARDTNLTNTSKPRIIVLFSDGEQNQAPMVDSGGCEFDDGTSINNPPGGPPACGDPGTIKVMTVGVGDPSGMYHNTLQNLAANNRGQYIVTSNGQDFNWSDGTSLGDITAAFYSAIFPALSSSSPQMVAFYSGTLTNTITLPSFNLNKKVNQLMILFSFNRYLEMNQLKRLLAGWRITKDGTDVTEFFEPVNLGALANAVLLKTNFIRARRDPDSSGTAVIAPEGSYTVEMTLQPNIVPPLDFRVIPYADDHRMRMEWEVVPAAPRVHQSFTPTVRLSWLGSPVVNANVEAWILKPGDDLGDLLARNPQKIDPSSAPDAGSPGHQKYLHLIEKDPGFVAELKSKEQRLTLTYQGGGQYSAPYEPGDVSGVYQILYRVNASLPAFGELERLAVQSVYTRFGDIDLARSAVSTAVKNNTVTINFRPITTYGRFIGPAQASAFSIDGADTRLSNITDHQDGSYTLVLAGNPDAQVSIKLLGVEIYKGPASKAGKGFDLLVWLIWLVIILILLLLIWLIWRVI